MTLRVRTYTLIRLYTERDFELLELEVGVKGETTTTVTFYSSGGVPLLHWRPGTRYAARALELAEELVAEAAKLLPHEQGAYTFDELRSALYAAVGVLGGQLAASDNWENDVSGDYLVWDAVP